MKDSAWATKAYSMNPHLSGEHFRCDYSLMVKNKMERKLTYYAILGWLILQKGNRTYLYLSVSKIKGLTYHTAGVAEDGTVMVIKKDARPADTESNESDDIRMIDVIDVDALDGDSNTSRGEGPSNRGGEYNDSIHYIHCLMKP